MTFDLDINLAKRFNETLYMPYLKVKIVGQSSWSLVTGWKCFYSRLWIPSIDCKMRMELGKPVPENADGNDTVLISVCHSGGMALYRVLML